MTPITNWVPNHRDSAWTASPVTGDAMRFHRGLEGYTPTPLVELPTIADELGVGRVFAKDESTRLGLPAFKALGASWAVDRAVAAARKTSPADRLEVFTATDGNHGRAVARFARLSGNDAQIFVPKGGVHPFAVEAIRQEGAIVVEVEGSYDDAVAAAAAAAAERGGILVQDTSWPGYEQVPAWIVEGYATLFDEIDTQLAEAGAGTPQLAVVPTGVGSLLQAALTHYRSAGLSGSTAVISVEPATAACVAASIEAGELVSLETTGTTMSGLNCGTPSTVAWPVIRAGLDAAVTVTDNEAIDAGRAFAQLGVTAGPCGAASLAGTRVAVLGDGAPARRAHLGIDETSVVVLIVTEGSDANPFPGEPPSALRSVQ